MMTTGIAGISGQHDYWRRLFHHQMQLQHSITTIINTSSI